MNTTPVLALRNPSRLRPILFAFIGIPLLSLLAFFWLEIPDSHLWQLALSLLGGISLVIAFVTLVRASVRSIRNAAIPCSRTLGTLLIACWLVVKWMLVRLVSHIDDNSMQRAGYWNSKLSAGMRNTFTFDRLIAWQHDTVLILLWIVIPALLTPFFIETVSRGLGRNVWRSAAATFRRWQHWLAIVVCDVAVYWLSGKLTGWRPSHSVHGELMGLVLRLTLCYVADFALICLLLFIDSRLLAREHARWNPAAEPSSNVP